MTSYCAQVCERESANESFYLDSESNRGEMTLLYRATQQSSEKLARLEAVIYNERPKTRET